MPVTNIEKTPDSEKRKSTLTRNIADINKNLNNTEKQPKNADTISKASVDVERNADLNTERSVVFG